MNFIRRVFETLSPQRFFLIIASCFGSLFLFLTPPFQVPDEPNHFYRAWQVADGGLLSIKQDRRVGGYLPESLEKIMTPYYKIIWAKDRKARDVDMSGLLEIPLNNQNKKFYDFNNTAFYSPICYLPEALGIFIFKSLNAPPLFALYAARLMALLTWLLVGFFCIKVLPIYKWLFTLFALLPMSVFINMSINADVVTNAVCFLFIALNFRYAFDEQIYSANRLRNTAISILLLTSVKVVYAPLILLILLIPKRKFKSTKDWLTKISLLFILAIGSSAIWSALLNPYYINYDNYHPDFRDGAAIVVGADIPQQINYILHNGSYIFNVLYDSVILTFGMFTRGYIGVFGWLDSPLPNWVTYLCYVALFLTALLEGNQKLALGIKQKTIFATAFLTMFLLIFLAQHLIWDVVGAPLIQNIQGRYLIPIAPLLFISFYNRKRIKPFIAQYITCFTVLIALFVSLQVIIERYY